VASGGELSRVFLALKQALRESGTGMVLVFDEVDTGVGGRVADRVGRMLADLAVHHQVLCITHLPQIAAFAQTHFRVAKDAADGRTVTRITRVEGPDRIEEIARMAGGESVGKATLAHARDLLASRAVPQP
jgi:DNA repair protein RecN (Recombination protein N)